MKNKLPLLSLFFCLSFSIYGENRDFDTIKAEMAKAITKCDIGNMMVLAKEHPLILQGMLVLESQEQSPTIYLKRKIFTMINEYQERVMTLVEAGRHIDNMDESIEKLIEKDKYVKESLQLSVIFDQIMACKTSYGLIKERDSLINALFTKVYIPANLETLESFDTAQGFWSKEVEKNRVPVQPMRRQRKEFPIIFKD